MPVKYSDYRKNTDAILDERRKIAEYNKQFPEETKVEKDTTFGGTLGYLLGKFGSGAVGGYEGIADFIAPALKATGKLTSKLVDNPVGEFIFGKDAGDPENNPIYQLGENMIRDEVGKTFSERVDEDFGGRSAFDDNSLATKIAAGAGRITAAATFGNAAGQAINIPNIAKTGKTATMLNNIINQANNPTMQAFAMDIFGSSYAEASNSGASDEEAGIYAILNTAKETGIEMISGGVGGLFGKGAIDDYVTEFLIKRAKTKIGQMGIKLASGMVGEGLEEVLAGLMSPFIDYVYKHDLDFSTYKQLVDDFIVGALTSGVLQGGRALYGKVLDPSTTVYEQIIGEYIESISDDINVYEDAQNEILNAIDSSVDPDEIVELNEANSSVATTIEELKLRLEQLTALQKPSTNSSAEKIPDVLKVVPDTTEVDTNLKAKDSEGRSLTQQQADYFKDSKIRDENGNLLTMYHGTPTGGFTVFDMNNVDNRRTDSVSNEASRLGYYFTDNLDYATSYSEDINELSRFGKNSQVYETYLNIKNPLIYRDNIESIFTSKKKLYALKEQLKNGEYDGIYDPDLGVAVAFKSNQIKKISNMKPTSSPDITDKKSAPATKKQTTKTVTEKKRGTVTKEQIKKIHTLLGKDGKLKEQVYKEMGITSSTELSKEKASELIDKLENGTTRSDKIESVTDKNIQKVKLQNITAGVEIKGVASQKTLDKIEELSVKKFNKHSKDYLLQKTVDSAYTIDKLADEVSKTDKEAGKRLRYANDMRFNAVTIAINQEVDAQVDYKTGKKIGKSINEILKPFEDNKTIDELEAYVYIKSNLERKQYGKDNKGIDLTEEQQKEFIARMDLLHPEFKAAQKEINKYYRNLLQNEVGGRVDQELADYLNEKYADYARFYNKNVNRVYVKGDKIMVAKAVKTAEGGKYQLSGLRESMVRATNASVQGVLDNNLRLELLNCLGGVQLKVTENYQPVLQTNDGWMIVAYKNGIPYGVTVSKGIVDAMQLPGITETEEALANYLKIPKKLGEARRRILTDMNPLFTLWRNPWRDLGDVIVNSKHTRKTLLNMPRAFIELARNGEVAKRYKALGGFASSYFDYDGKKRNRVIRTITNLNQLIEQTPRLAEFMSSLQSGASVQEAMYDAAEVTTNFKRGGVWTKALNRNGFTFLNASVQGMYKQYRNLKGANGVKGYVNLLAKTIGVGIASAALNELLNGDDEEYQNLPDYIKDQYYLFKTEKGYVKIPKGRVISIFDKAARNVNDIIKGTDDQFHALKLIGFAYDQIGPNNPISENILAPLFQAASNEKWTGDPIDNKYETDKSGTSYKLPKDRVAKNTTLVAKFLSGLLPAELDVSPKKIDYVIDQYGGFYYDLLKPALTQTEEYVNMTENPLFSSMFVDTVYSNKNISEVYDLVGPLKVEADKNKDNMDAQFQYKYVNSQLYQINSLYGDIRKYVTAHPHDNAAKVKEMTKQINEIANETVEKYKTITSETITYDGKEYFISNGTAYRYDKNGTLRKCTSKVCKEVLNSK